MGELTLGEICPNRLSSYITKLKDVNMLYLLCYGKEGCPKTNRKDVRAFKGFRFDNDEEYEAKRDFITNTFEELIKLNTWFQFEVTGSKERLAERLCTRLIKLDQLIPDEDDDESEDEDKDEDIHKDKDANDDNCQVGIQRRTNSDSATSQDDDAQRRKESRRLLGRERITRRNQQSTLPEDNYAGNSKNRLQDDYDERCQEDNDMRYRRDESRRINDDRCSEDDPRCYDDEPRRPNDEVRHRNCNTRRINDARYHNEERYRQDFTRREHYKCEYNNQQTHGNKINTQAIGRNIRPRDIETLIPTFTADDDYPIEKWLLDFEEVARMINLN